MDITYITECIGWIAILWAFLTERGNWVIFDLVFWATRPLAWLFRKL